MGARHKPFFSADGMLAFQSTRPHGGATVEDFAPVGILCISIHAPAWGRDNLCVTFLQCYVVFQSTRPHGGATVVKWLVGYYRDISIHAPAWGRDAGLPRVNIARSQFQSTRPHGGATDLHVLVIPSVGISIHAPAWGRDGACLHGLNYSGHAIFFANLIFSRAVTGIFRRKVLCVIRVRTEILRLFSRRRCLLQHQSSFSLITWFCTDVLRFSCVFIA